MPESTEARPNTKKCPFCAETIQAQAVKCRYCCEFLDPRYNYTSAPPAPPSAPWEASGEGEKKEAVDSDEEGDSLYWGRPSVLALGKLLIGSAVLFGIAVFLCFYPLEAIIKPTGEFTAEHAARVIRGVHVVGGAMAVATLLVLALKIAALKSISYEVTPDRIEWARGIFSRKIDNLDMFRIIDLKLHRSLLDCVLGIGTISLITKDQTDPQFEFIKIRAPRYLYDIIKKASLVADRKQKVVHIE